MPDDRQTELHLLAPPVTGATPLVPARMVNEFVYCPRLATSCGARQNGPETGGTVEGRRVHRRVDKPGTPLPAPGSFDDEAATADRIVSRLVTLSSEKLGIIAKLVVAEAEGGVVVPIDYKRGKRPHVGPAPTSPSASRSASRLCCSRSTATACRKAGSTKQLVKNGEDHLLLIDVGPADAIYLAVESMGKTFAKTERQATVL